MYRLQRNTIECVLDVLELSMMKNENVQQRERKFLLLYTKEKTSMVKKWSNKLFFLFLQSKKRREKALMDKEHQVIETKTSL
jgi:hypothetical protein